MERPKFGAPQLRCGDRRVRGRTQQRAEGDIIDTPAQPHRIIVVEKIRTINTLEAEKALHLRAVAPTWYVLDQT
ncbi:MAG: hypothetical protein AAGC95_09480 [Pseudomonadota bacterium]